VVFSEDNIRRLKLENISMYAQFVLILKEKYSSFLQSDFTIKYTDKEGDLISISSQLEWEEMLRELSSPYRVFIVPHTSEKISQNKPEEKSPNLNESSTNQSFDLNQIFSQYAPFLKNLIPGKSEYPNQSSCNTNESNSCSFFEKMQNKGIFWMYHKKAMKCLESLDENVIQEGKQYLFKMLDIVPNDKNTLYNLACAESLLKNVDEALKNLEKSISAGYRDLAHLLNDKDFNNIKFTEGFTAIVKNLENIVFDSQSNDAKTEEKTEEKKVEVNNKTELKDEWEKKAKELSEMGFDLPLDILKEFLKKCDGSLEKVIAMIYQ